ncbi:hypothetical protein PAXRUDRAFT_379360 [Paxillus rubicundulus Ve08.2h10]|uniref:Uncharacterized protein n=1 Tax=Paxillus rubicundulus Ve08.2h10 TaxID=930991 RepID=A0A0D0DHC7_9AGAM|nr:hypothetical protein PAXRUDRAFT_379360 [Paxillus rubicundulus Ve08.2h10]
MPQPEMVHPHLTCSFLAPLACFWSHPLVLASPLVFGLHLFIFDPAHLFVTWSHPLALGSATLSLSKMNSPPQTWTCRLKNDPATSTADSTCRKWIRHLKNDPAVSKVDPTYQKRIRDLTNDPSVSLWTWRVENRPVVSKRTPSPQTDPSPQEAGVSRRLSLGTRPAASKRILSQQKRPCRLNSRPDGLKTDPSPPKQFRRLQVDPACVK